MMDEAVRKALSISAMPKGLSAELGPRLECIEASEHSDDAEPVWALVTCVHALRIHLYSR